MRRTGAGSLLMRGAGMALRQAEISRLGRDGEAHSIAAMKNINHSTKYMPRKYIILSRQCISSLAIYRKCNKSKAKAIVT